MLAGLMKPTFGEIRVLGMNIKNDLRKIRKLIGFCPRESNISKYLTPREILWFYSNVKNIPASICEHVSILSVI